MQHRLKINISMFLGWIQKKVSVNKKALTYFWIRHMLLRVIYFA